MSNIEPIRSTTTIVSVDQLPVQSILSHRGKNIVVDHAVDQDEAIILALGYQNSFKREFSLWSTFAVSFSVLGLLPSIASCTWYSVAYSGNAGLTWAWLVALIGIFAVAGSMAELASAYPTSGGLYYATSQLAPPKYAVFLSWWVGWSNWLVQITGAPSVNYGGACMILALKTFNDPDYIPTNGQTYLLTMALCFVTSIISSFPTKWVAYFNSVGTSLNLIFLFIVWVMILGGDNRESQGLPKFNSNSFAWGIDNFTEWPDGIAILMSFMAVIWTMSGYDSPFHLAEECSNAQIATPRAIVLTATVGGVLGFIFQLALAYTVVDIDAAVNADLGQPYVSILAQVLDKKMVYAATGMTVISSFCMGQACQVAASRVTFAYSRDGCFPFSKYWMAVNPITQTPVNAVWFNWFIGQLLLLLIFAGGSAIDAIFSVGAIGSFISFTLPILLRITYSRNTFKPGPWNLGKFSTVSGVIASCFVILMIPILCFPQYRGADNTPDSMNWTVVVYFGPMFLASAWYFIYAHKVFKGPRSNIDPSKFVSDDDEAEVIDAKIASGDEVHVYGSNGDIEKTSSGY
ncbi:unnamed protein product [[Candida] boidinii]|nr:hypothetical protein B5S33_g3001 [[Candida] boidinii]GMF02655.1 unnamed protein product [[Candida] boidinii]